MRGHDHIRSGTDSFDKRNQVAGEQFLFGMIRARKVGMAVLSHVAVTRKMLKRSTDAVFVQSFHESLHVFRHFIRIIGESTRRDDGIIGIAVDVGDRGEVHVKAQCADLLSQHIRTFFRQRQVSRRGKAHVAGSGRTERHPVDPAALLVHADQHGNPQRGIHRSRLAVPDQRNGLLRVHDISGKQDQAAEIVFFQQVFIRRVKLRYALCSLHIRPQCNDHHLGQLLLGAHTGKNLIHLFFHIFFLLLQSGSLRAA